MDRRWLWIGAVILLIAVYFVARSLTRERLPVRVAEAAEESISSTISNNGKVEPEKNYEVHSPITALVKAVYVQPGDEVPAGKLLLQLDDIEVRAKLASADSAVKAAQAILDSTTQNGTLEQRQGAAAEVERDKLDRDQAQHDLDALAKLNSTGAASPSEVAAARQRLATADANLHAAQVTVQSRYSPSEVARARAALEDAQANRLAAQQVLSQTSVHAPFAGTVYSLDIKPTELADQGKLLLQIADLHHERVRAYFDEPEIGRLAVGQPITIKWDAKLGTTWHGQIERVPVTITTYGTRNVGEVIVHVDDNPDGHLLPDTNVTVTVTTSSESNALSIPRDALRSENGKTYVYKLDGDELKKTFVVAGTLNISQVAIVSGLKSGDLVATGTTTGQPLQEGVPIKRVQ